MWKAEPDRIKVLDVRTFEEYVLIGHAEMAVNIPLPSPPTNGMSTREIIRSRSIRFHARAKERFKPYDTI